MAQRTYVIPLRREFLKVPRHQRSKKAMTALKQFLVKHLKTENVLIGPKINEIVWKDGIKNPPHKVKVNASIVDGIAKVELFGFEYPKAIEKATKAPQGMKEKLQAAVADAKGPAKEEKSSEAKEEKPKAEAKPKAAEKKAEPKKDSSEKKESKPAKEEKPKAEKKAEPKKEAAKK